jgi:hypothetical protein
VVSQILEEIDDSRLRVYVVWEKILATDDEDSSIRAASLLTDDRAAHFWTASKTLGAAFQEPIGLTNEPAWDVYLCYSPGVLFEGAPPAPNVFFHQLTGRLPEDKRLRGSSLVSELHKLLGTESELR